jgi:predicted restriction endonuclease
MKPWRDSDNKERLNPYNGLLLTANLDAAFDSGLITFSRNGEILIAREFTDAGDFGITPSMKLREIDAQHQEYLTWHRDNEFKG